MMKIQDRMTFLAKMDWGPKDPGYPPGYPPEERPKPVNRY
jgi:hypothetical protein